MSVLFIQFAGGSNFKVWTSMQVFL